MSNYLVAIGERSKIEILQSKYIHAPSAIERRAINPHTAVWGDISIIIIVHV